MLMSIICLRLSVLLLPLVSMLSSVEGSDLGSDLRSAGLHAISLRMEYLYVIWNSAEWICLLSFFIYLISALYQYGLMDTYFMF